MAFQKGQSGNPKGREPGTPNKTTATMKAAIQSVYDDLQKTTGEPHGHFLTWAKSNETEFYKLASKLLPIQTEVTGADGSNLFDGLKVTFVKPDGR